jgi:acyl-CoA:acyl-CoA alkyltransferase
MLTTKIESVASHHPAQIVRPYEIIEDAGLINLDVPKTHIEDLTGIKTMHYASAEMRPSDIAKLAIEKCLQDFSGNEAEIDAVFFCGMTRDMQEPSTAHILNHHCGLSARFCIDIADACHGFMAGLITADALIRSGAFRNILVCTGEVASKGTHHIANRFKKGELGINDVKHNLGAFTVGDAGGAMILGPADDGTGFQTFNTNSKSSVWDACYVDWETNSFAMHMVRISAETIRMVGKMGPQTLESVGWKNDDIDMFVAHQVGRRVQDSYLKQFQIEKDHAIEVYQDYGNLTSVSVPACFDLLKSLGKLQKGLKTLINSTGSGIVVTQVPYIV